MVSMRQSPRHLHLHSTANLGSMDDMKTDDPVVPASGATFHEPIAAVAFGAPYAPKPPVSASARVEAAWEARLEQLKMYVQQHGHARMTRSTAPSRGLVNWLHQQRHSMAEGALPLHQAEALTQLGVTPLEPVSNGDRWEMQRQKLESFASKHGHCEPALVLHSDKNLREWVRHQRAKHDQGELTPGQIAKLEQMGFSWEESGQKALRSAWEQRLGQLRQFYEQHGHSHVTPSNEPVPGLYDWCKDQRSRHRRGTLSPLEGEGLEAMNFPWEILPPSAKPKDRGPVPIIHAAPDAAPGSVMAAWEACFELLRAYKAEYGHLDVSAETNAALHDWLADQREGREYGRLHWDQIERLERLGFSWTAGD